MGLVGAVLAKMGFTGSADVFGPKGFFDTFLFGKAEPHLLVDNFGAPFRMVDPGVGFKKHPSNYFTHRPIDAALMLREQHNIKPEQIAKVDVVFPRFEYVNRPQPETGLDGKFSVQYTTTVALLDGEITVDSFNNERRFAPDVEALLQKITLHLDDNIPNDFDRMHIDMKVTLTDGRVLTQRVDKLSGWVGSPLTREQRMRKFHSCAKRVLARETADRIVAIVENLEQQPSVGELMTLVRDRKSTRLNSSHIPLSRMPSSA